MIKIMSVFLIILLQNANAQLPVTNPNDTPKKHTPNYVSADNVILPGDVPDPDESYSDKLPTDNPNEKIILNENTTIDEIYQTNNVICVINKIDFKNYLDGTKSKKQIPSKLGKCEIFFIPDQDRQTINRGAVQMCLKSPKVETDNSLVFNDQDALDIYDKFVYHPNNNKLSELKSSCPDLIFSVFDKNKTYEITQEDANLFLSLFKQTTQALDSLHVGTYENESFIKKVDGNQRINDKPKKDTKVKAAH